MRIDAMIDRTTISLMKACDLAAVNRWTIYTWMASGKVEYVRTAGGSIRIFVDSLWRTPWDTEQLGTAPPHRTRTSNLLQGGPA